MIRQTQRERERERERVCERRRTIYLYSLIAIEISLVELWQSTHFSFFLVFDITDNIAP